MNISKLTTAELFIEFLKVNQQYGAIHDSGNIWEIKDLPDYKEIKKQLDLIAKEFLARKGMRMPW